MPDQMQPQLLHLVFGGELTDLEHVTFKDLAKAQLTVDNAQMRYFIVHLHRLLDPSTDKRP
jgi:hypothetical protein